MNTDPDPIFCIGIKRQPFSGAFTITFEPTYPEYPVPPPSVGEHFPVSCPASEVVRILRLLANRVEACYMQDVPI